MTKPARKTRSHLRADIRRIRETKALRPAWEREGDRALPILLASVDLQCLKACGVTFAVSAIEALDVWYRRAHAQPFRRRTIAVRHTPDEEAGILGTAMI